MAYELEITARFKRAYRGKTPEQRQQLDETLKRLAENPRHPGLNAHYIVRRDKIWECYTNDSFRVTYEYQSDEEGVIVCRNKCAHDQTLRNP